MSPPLCGHHQYPGQSILVLPFEGDLTQIFDKPPGLESDWPPIQLSYIGVYLAKLNCRTVVLETHYIDRDYISELALFYARSLRNYPNYCSRLHFFAEAFDQEHWRRVITTVKGEERSANISFLQNSYLGFCVVRPLPGSPIGRTVLKTIQPDNIGPFIREFPAVRDYNIHLAGTRLRVSGLAFQQQDQGVSACATTALWSSIHAVAHKEGLSVPTPADITEAASRYFLAEGRSLPSEGLTVQQICEATRAAGLSPLIIRSVTRDHDRAQLLGYLRSGFAPVLAIQPIGGPGHAVCAVGLKIGEVGPQADPKLHFRDTATSVCGVYLHDDRLGPYASADLYGYTDKNTGNIKTALLIRWPDKTEVEESVLVAMIVPVPTKLRLTVTRMRELGLALADAAGQMFVEFDRLTTLKYSYCRGSEYLERAHTFQLTLDGLYKLTCQCPLSRYVGVIEIFVPEGPLFDVILDATETRANPATLVCVRRSFLPSKYTSSLDSIARKLGASLIV